MKTTLSITIDCEEKTCGICAHLEEIDLDDDYCELFIEYNCQWTKLDYDKNMFPLRCDACLAAQEGANE